MTTYKILPIENFPCSECGKVSTVATTTDLFRPICHDCAYRGLETARELVQLGGAFLEVINGKEAIKISFEER